MPVQQVTILGATGSIGKSTLKVLAQHPDQYQVYALTGFQRLDELAQLVEQHSPKVVVVPEGKIDTFRSLLALHCNDKQIHTIEIVEGETGLCQVASAAAVNVVMAAIVGSAGLKPTLAAIDVGKRVLLANKEALVMAGELFMQRVKQAQATLLPVDSEHNAIFQCLPTDYFSSSARFANQGNRAGVSQILLTASGGPFRTWTLQQMHQATPAQACKHPNWSMGQKISVDSATLMNKGLELIEACHLFELPVERVTVVIHPESIVHSLVQYIDGSTLAQLGNPDMCTPIAHALAWPQRIATTVPPLDLFSANCLNFEQPDEDRFPALALAKSAMKTGGCAPAVLNAANEVAVAAFLANKIAFTQITQLIHAVITQINVLPAHDLDTILVQDLEARELAGQWIMANANRTT
ncbi:1-deoxy-D-xylulose-5-phosphate reductoisomerase [Alkanindiges illinoisensis]|uniref:1-deoxy-D-xylulose-5-phosphate reductoisomerase n=1 Tax=Alkanindiges illinoisensis TaxID=197183 RepID=UPI00054D18C5|nr:1-deoxy-D-xylulose-5-phosphate reductoisomerase [Alkanindiges illinoisensis]